MLYFIALQQYNVLEYKRRVHYNRRYLFKNPEPQIFVMHPFNRNLVRLKRENVGSYMRVFTVSMASHATDLKLHFSRQTLEARDITDKILSVIPIYDFDHGETTL